MAITHQLPTQQDFVAEMMYVAKLNATTQEIRTHREPVLVESGCSCRMNQEPLKVAGPWAFSYCLNETIFICYAKQRRLIYLITRSLLFFTQQMVRALTMHSPCC